MIRRPILYAGCAAAAAVMVSYYAGSGAAAVLAAGLLLAAVLLPGEDRSEGGSLAGSRRRRIAALVLVSYVLGGIAFWHEDRALTGQAEHLNGCNLRGEILDCAKKQSQSGEPYLQLIIKTERGRVLAKYYDPPADQQTAAEGCTAALMGKLQEPEPRRNPGCFDYALYLRSIGVTKVMTCDSLTVDSVRPFQKEPAAYIRNSVCKVRERFLENLEAETDRQTAGMMRAIMFGDKGGLDQETLETFQKNGTAHILAVSGLHIGIIYGFILKLWRWRRGWTFLSFNMVFFLLYAAAAGFSPSVTRAVIMVLLHIVAGIRGWRYDLSNAAFAVGMGVLLRNPFMLFNTGFQMSFLAVLTLVLVLPYIRRFYEGVLLASLAVQIGLGPYILYQFNYLSLLAVLINVPVVAMAGLIVPAGLSSMALAGTPCASGIFEIVRALCCAMQKLNETGQIDGITSFQVPSPPLWIMAAYYLCLLLFATEEGRLALIRASSKSRYVLNILLIVAVLSAGFHAFASDGFGKCDLTFIDVGQGDCVCVKTEDSFPGKDRCFLFDGGGSTDYNIGKSILRSYLLKNGVSHVDGAFVTHLHTDHYKGICELAQLGMVERLYTYEANRLRQKQIMADTGLDEEDIVFLCRGDRVRLGRSKDRTPGNHNSNYVYLDVLHPARKSAAQYRRMLEDETDENALSLVFKVTFSGPQAGCGVLITGDLGEEGETELMQNYKRGHAELKTEILKVGHHGSKTSSSEAFLDAVRPSLAVIQVGKNNMYGHPSPETLQRLADRAIPVCRNDLQGAIGVEIKGGRVKKVKAMIK